MNSIKKKILTGILSATVAFSAVGFSACGNGEQAEKLAELELKLLQQQTQIADIAQEKEDLAEQLTAQIENLEEENEDLQSAINALEQQNEDLLEVTTGQSSQILELQQVNEDLQTEIEEQLFEVNAQQSLYQEQITQLQNKNNELEEIIASKRDDLELNFAINNPLYEKPVDDVVMANNMIQNSGNILATMQVRYPNENVVFECSTNYGKIRYAGEISNSFTIPSNSGFAWTSNSEEIIRDDIFIDIKIKAQEEDRDRIIGYAVIKMYYIDEYEAYLNSLLKCVILPDIDGRKQYPIEKQIDYAMIKVKLEA